MKYKTYCMSRRGATHIKLDMPCQDYSMSEEYNGSCIAMVSDGHGNKKHYLSDRGSKIACNVAMEEVKSFLDMIDQTDINDRAQMDNRLNELKEKVCFRWKQEVKKDFYDNGFDDLSDENDLKEEQIEIAYGCTLCVAFTAEWGWAAIQIGDGSFTIAEENGKFKWVMPESILNEDNLTASLCLYDPMEDFRHVYGNDKPIGFFVYTDGIEKVLPEQGKEIISFLDWVIKNDKDNSERKEETLRETLDIFSARSHIGDDVSIAYIYDEEAMNIKPKYEEADKNIKMKSLRARVEELKSTIDYNNKLLEELGNEEWFKKCKIRMLVKSKEEELAQLEKSISELSDGE